jgi:hypothetical protein
MAVVKVLPSRQAPWPKLIETLGHPPVRFTFGDV